MTVAFSGSRNVAEHDGQFIRSDTFTILVCVVCNQSGQS
jgi:hypothetical protein